MKKLFTLVALLACFMGAKAEWVTDYTIDYSQNTGFPFYVMGYVPEWIDGVMTDFGANYRYETQANLDGDGDGKWKDGESSVGTVTNQGGTEYQKVTGAGPYWHQYFIADGIPTEIDGSYTVKAWVKASETVTVTVNMGWGWGDGQKAAGSVSIPQSDDFVEVEWSYSGIAGTSCNLVAQPGTSTAVIEWKSLSVSHNQKAQRPVTWQEWLTSDGQPVIVETESKDIATWMGNAETPWADPNVKFNDQTQNYLICAWSKEKGRNLNDDEGSDPFPADIEVDETDPTNHVFVCHGQPATTEGDASGWDNQFWIESPKNWKEGEQLKIHFRYRATATVKTNTQVHKQNPSDYKNWQAIGDITFTTEWQEYDKVISWPSGAGDESWSIAFNLNPEVKDAVTFYFDDLSWQSMKLDEGFFVAGCNPDGGLEYDFDNAIEFTDEDEDGVYEAVIGELGNPDSYVSQIMISTVRGNDAAFKSNTLKPSGTIVSDPDEWPDYAPASLAKLTLPGLGVWKVYIDPAYGAMAFEMLEGSEIELKEINPNPTEIVINALEREYTEAEAEAAGIEKPETPGQAWDNQFWIVANRALATGEKTIVQFKYKATKAAKASTQSHGEPGAYIHWGAIGDVNFTEEWQDFEATFTIPSEANEMKSIAFNLSEIKDANDYYIKDVVWKLDDGTESLINETGSENFYVKVLGGSPVVFVPGGETDGINNVATNSNNTVSAVIVNLAGQRVSKDYKGLVIKNGKKVVLK